MSESVEIKYMGKSIKNHFGGSDIEVEYVMTHRVGYNVNKYLVTCNVCGIEAADPHLHANNAEFMGVAYLDSNQETLTNEAACWLFEDNI